MKTKISHHHFEEIQSTQSFLKEKLATKKTIENILISASQQSDGVGRFGNKWDNFGNSLAFSFTVRTPPDKSLSLLPLELSTLLVKWLNIKTGVALKVKWPNDILTTKFQKCGGILCHYINPKMIIAGIGLNYGPIHFKSNHLYKTNPGFISNNIQLSKDDKKNLPMSFYNFFLENLPSNESKLPLWENLCIHMNQKVKISHSDNNFKIGTFKGIGSNGEAILELENKKVEKFISGSLDILK